MKTIETTTKKITKKSIITANIKHTYPRVIKRLNTLESFKKNKRLHGNVKINDIDTANLIIGTIKQLEQSWNKNNVHVKHTMFYNPIKNITYALDINILNDRLSVQPLFSGNYIDFI